jgi:hypothetical protein
MVRFRFKRQRKIDRMEAILKESKLIYEKKNGIITEFIIRDIKYILDFFKPRKLWNAKLLNWSTNNLIVFVNELKYWDGHYTEKYLHKREEYLSKWNINALWVKTICHLVNKQGTILFDGDIYEVGINNRRQSIANIKQKINNWTGYVYCPTVSTGLFMIRRNFKISVTGNSGNYDIQAQTFRMNILEKSGGKIMIPMEESRRFLETYRSVFPEIPERNQRVQRQGRELGVLYNLFGHPYYITSYKGCWTENTYKEWYSWSPQSTVGMIINVAVGRWQEFVERETLNWDLLANGHDSMVSQVPLGEVLLGAAKSQEYVEKEEFESPVDGAKFFMKSETKVGFCWAPYDKVKCPLGLKEIKI